MKATRECATDRALCNETRLFIHAIWLRKLLSKLFQSTQASLFDVDATEVLLISMMDAPLRRNVFFPLLIARLLASFRPPAFWFAFVLRLEFNASANIYISKQASFPFVKTPPFNNDKAVFILASDCSKCYARVSRIKVEHTLRNCFNEMREHRMKCLMGTVSCEWN